jgi:hypothetical protein
VSQPTCQQQFSLTNRAVELPTSSHHRHTGTRRQIDNFQCIHSRLTLRLGARIFDLKQKGWDFRTEMREDKNTVYAVTNVPELTLFT